MHNARATSSLARATDNDYDVAGAFDPSTALVPALERNISLNLLPPAGLAWRDVNSGDLAMSIALTRSGFSIALSGFAIACCFLIGLQVSATTAAPSAGQTSLTINRTLKSDRMPLVPAITRNAVNGPAETNAPTGTAAPQPRPARRMRADGERHWAVAVGPDRWALRFLTGAGRESPFLAGGDGAAGSIKLLEKADALERQGET